MPTGTTSYRSGSRAAITLPNDTQEIACSALRPPNTTATRTLPACPLITPVPSRATPQPPGGGADPAVAAAGSSVWEPRQGQDHGARPGAPGTTRARERRASARPWAPRPHPSRGPPLARAPLGAPAGRCGRPPLHGQRLGPRAADRDRRPGGERGHRPLAGAGAPVHRRDRRDPRPPLPGEGDAPLVRRRPSRRHRRLPDLRVRPRRPAVDDRPAALRRDRVGAGGIAAAVLQLPVLPGGRKDRRPLLPRLPELLEHRRLLRVRAGPRPGDDRNDPRRLLGAGVRSRAVRLSLAHPGLPEPDAGPHGPVAGHLRRPRGPAAPPEPVRDRALAGLPGLLRRAQRLH